VFRRSGACQRTHHCRTRRHVAAGLGEDHLGGRRCTPGIVQSASTAWANGRCVPTSAPQFFPRARSRATPQPGAARWGERPTHARDSAACPPPWRARTGRDHPRRPGTRTGSSRPPTGHAADRALARTAAARDGEAPAPPEHAPDADACAPRQSDERTACRGPRRRSGTRPSPDANASADANRRSSSSTSNSLVLP
jgi:hypothetical protein